MLIKFGHNVVVNVTAIKNFAVNEKTKKVIVAKGGLFTPDTFKEVKEYEVELNYRNIDGKDASYTLTCGENLAMAINIHKELTAQIKEVELESMTSTLESAIRGN